MTTSTSAAPSAHLDLESCCVCFPVVGEELTMTVRRLGEVLLTLDGWEAHGGRLPEPLARRGALESVGRLYRALAPAQTPPGPPEVRGAERERPYPPLGFAEIAATDVELMSATVASFHRALVPEQPRPVDDSEEALGDALNDHRRPGETLLTLVGQADRLSRLLDAGWDSDLELIHNRLIQEAPDGTGRGSPIELDPGEEAAYQRITERLTAIWSGERSDIWRDRQAEDVHPVVAEQELPA